MNVWATRRAWLAPSHSCLHLQLCSIMCLVTRLVHVCASLGRRAYKCQLKDSMSAELGMLQFTVIILLRFGSDRIFKNDSPFICDKGMLLCWSFEALGDVASKQTLADAVSTFCQWKYSSSRIHKISWVGMDPGRALLRPIAPTRVSHEVRWGFSGLFLIMPRKPTRTKNAKLLWTASFNNSLH